MRMRVPLLGSGTMADPYRADLPTYTIVEHSTSLMLAVVDIPDDDVPPAFLFIAVPEALPQTATVVAEPLAPLAQTEWREHLDTRYAEHKGKFTPNTA